MTKAELEQLEALERRYRGLTDATSRAACDQVRARIEELRDRDDMTESEREYCDAVERDPEIDY